MNYIFKGNLCAYLCSDCSEPFAFLKVRLYRSIGKDVALLAAANARETFHQVTASELDAKSNLLLAETVTDAKGNFSFNLGEKQGYKGEAFDVDFVCGTGYVKQQVTFLIQFRCRHLVKRFAGISSREKCHIFTD